MNKRTAYKLGVESGCESGRFGDFNRQELSSEGAFLEACAEICINKRQNASSPTYAFAREPNADNLFDAFEEGESVGAMKAWCVRKPKGQQ